MMIGVNTYTMAFAGDTEARIAKAAELGFDGIEFRPEDFELAGELSSAEADAEKIRTIFGKYGVEPATVACDADFVQTDSEQFDRWVRWGEYCAALSVKLGLKVVKYFAGEGKPDLLDEEVVGLMVRGSTELARIGEKYSVAFAEENHGHFTNNPEVQFQLLRASESSRLGVCIDSSNYRWYGHSLDDVHRIFREMAPYAMHAHIKDGDGSAGGDYKATALGEGELDIPLLFDELKKNGYKGDLILEYEGPDGEDGVRRSLAYLRKLAKDTFGV